MRKFFSILAVALILVASSSDLGQSKSRPYDPGDMINGSPTEDHPWGGDNTGGGGTTGGTGGGTISTRPSYTASTGNLIIDLFSNHLFKSTLFQNRLHRGFDRQVTPEPTVTPTTSTSQSN